MKYFIRLIIIIIIFIIPNTLLSANEKTAFIDIDYIIQNSTVGKITLNKIETLNKKNITLLEKKNKNLRDLESKIMSKKNIISEGDYNNEVKTFQKKVNDFNIEKNQIAKDFKKFRTQELEKIFVLFNPIITNYMKKNSVNILIDSKNIFMGSAEANSTENILKIINDQLK